MPKVGRTVRIYRNGASNFAGRQFVIPIRTTQLSVFLDLISDTLKQGFNVQRLFAVDGTGIDELDQVQDGQSYVAGGRGSFKALDYTSILDDRALAELNKSRQPNDYSPPKKRITFRSLAHIVMRVQVPDKPTQIAVIRNGDASCTFINVLLTKRNAGWDVLLSEISDRLQMGAPVRKLYTAAGHQVTEVADLTDGGTYVAAEKKFKRLVGVGGGTREYSISNTITPKRVQQNTGGFPSLTSGSAPLIPTIPTKSLSKIGESPDPFLLPVLSKPVSNPVNKLAFVQRRFLLEILLASQVLCRQGHVREGAEDEGTGSIPMAEDSLLSEIN
jgi:hypothetical protein